MKLRHKFAFVFSPLLALIFAFGIVGGRAFFSINQIVANLQRDVTSTAFAIIEFKEILISLEAALNAGEIDSTELEAQITRLKGLLKRHLPRDEPADGAIQKTNEELRLRASRVISLARYILNVTENNWQEGKIARVQSRIHQEQTELGTILDKKLVIHLRGLDMAERGISEQYHRGVCIICCTFTVAFLMALFMVIYLARTVLSPIKILQGGVRQIGNGTLDYHMVLQTGDEFEELAADFEAMATKLADSYSQLDRKVLSRTEELSLANLKLQKEIGERLQAEDEQQKAEEQVRDLTQELLLVQEVERKKIALDLHDNVAQELSAMKVMTEAFCADSALDQDQLRSQMSEWITVLNQCVGTIRELSYNLMPPGLEHLGIKSALASFCREFSQKNGLSVDFSSAGMERLSLALDYDTAINLYRLVQEALNNIKHHAAVSQAKVRLVASGPRIMLQIEDDGQGCDLVQARARAGTMKRLGLLGMGERVKLLDGTLKVQSRPQEGMKIFIEIPWEKTGVGEKKDPSC